ncbi:MAG: tail fiber domain-containing protein [Candidatus Eisenbacteria bacterium]
MLDKVYAFAGICLLAALVVTMASPGFGEIPKKINYQGRLVDSASGEPLPGTHSMTFKLYDALIDGTLLWSESRSVMGDSAGVVSVILGGVSPIDIPFDGVCWLEVEVDTEILVPRRELVSVPYAFHAADSDSLGGCGPDAYMKEDELNSITGEMITDGEITDDDISGDASIDPSKINGTAWTAGNDGAGSGLDADMVDGLNADAFADTGHLHDDRYYTQEDLNTPGSINQPLNPIDWTNLKNVPAGFADGTDDVGGVGDGHSLDAADGNPVDALYVDNDGNVGIGTETPGAQLEVASSDQVEIALNRSGSHAAAVISLQTAGSPDWFILTPSGGNSLMIEDASFGPTMTFLQGGNVGVGTVSPATKLDVEGSINTSAYYEIEGEKTIHRPGSRSLAIGVGTGTDESMYYNTFVGDSAGYHDRAFNNTYIGYRAGYSNEYTGDNTFIGYLAGRQNTGAGNVFVGSFTGAGNASASYNTFVGERAGASNDDGGANTFIGDKAGQANTHGEDNLFAGTVSGNFNTTGSYNTYLGTLAGYRNEAGSYNVCVGYNAGYWETGSDNLYIANGQDAADVLIYGDFATGRIGLGTLAPDRKLHIVGDGPRVLIEASSANPEVNFKLAGDPSSEVWAIYKHSVSEDLRFYQNGDRVTFENGTGNVAIGATDPEGYRLCVNGTAYSTGGWQGSDRRLKSDIRGIEDALGKVLLLNGVSFLWRTEQYPDRGLPRGRHYGLVAQEVEQVLPEIVGDGPNGDKALAYSEIIPVLVESIKEIKAESDELRSISQGLMAENEILKQRLAALEEARGY